MVFKAGAAVCHKSDQNARPDARVLMVVRGHVECDAGPSSGATSLTSKEGQVLHAVCEWLKDGEVKFCLFPETSLEKYPEEDDDQY